VRSCIICNFSNVIRIIVSRKRWDGHKSHVDDLQWGVQFFSENMMKRPLVRPNFGARIILKWTATNRM
jgi:hypothetical protein